MQMQLLCFWMESGLYTPKAGGLEARVGSLGTSGFVFMYYSWTEFLPGLQLQREEGGSSETSGGVDKCVLFPFQTGLYFFPTATVRKLVQQKI